MEEKKGMPLKNRKGELIKCDCGGIYKWTGAIKLSYPPQYVFSCNKCNSNITIRAERLFPERYPEFQRK